jgi:16S rRNA (uracil1498-N3)-methyltransferase
MPAFFVSPDQITGQTVTLSGPLMTHLYGSLRIQAGEEIRLTEERRRRLLIKVTQIDRWTLRGQILVEEPAPAPRSPRIILGQAMLKGDHMDWVIQKATELGVETIAPLVSDHVIVRPRAARIGTQTARWQRIALEAAQQAERWDIPVVAPPSELPAFLAAQAGEPCRLILLERSGSQSLRDLPLPESAKDRIVLLVGPEGGWRDSEGAEALAQGYRPIWLGSRILRAETAVLAALSVLQNRLGELG